MKRQLLNVSAAALVAAFAVTMIAAPVFAGAGTKTRWVDNDGHAGPTSCRSATSAFKHVQAAINASDTNDKVLVCPGSYHENLDIQGNRNGLVVKSVMRRQARIIAPASGPPTMVYIFASRVQVVGFQLVAPTVAPCRRIDSMVSSVGGSNSTLIRDNIIRPAGTDTVGDCGYGVGVFVVGGAGIDVRGNIIRDFAGAAIQVIGGASARVVDNSIRYNHTAEAVGGVCCNAMSIVSSAVQVRRNRITSPMTAGSTTPLLNVGILLTSTTPGQVRIRRNIIRRMGAGLVLQSVSGALLVENRSRFNLNIDCFDSSTGGTGTAGTDNSWIDNVGDPAKSNPAAICALPGS